MAAAELNTTATAKAGQRQRQMHNRESERSKPSRQHPLRVLPYTCACVAVVRDSQGSMVSTSSTLWRRWASPSVMR